MLSGGVKKSLELPNNSIEIIGSQKSCDYSSTSSNVNPMASINTTLMSSTPINANLKSINNTGKLLIFIFKFFLTNLLIFKFLEQILLQNQVPNFSPLAVSSLALNYPMSLPIKDSLIPVQKKAKKSTKEKMAAKTKRKIKSDINVIFSNTSSFFKPYFFEKREYISSYIHKN